MAEGVFVTRSAGIGCEGIQDQYADGKAAQVWELMVGGGSGNRTRNYRQCLVNLLKSKGCRRILDVACGTGVDSVLLLEEGFQVTSIDASDKMLKHAFKKRWARRKEPAFDNWVIEEANWLTLPEDLEEMLDGGFDALICLGNSFAHLVDINGDQSKHKEAIKNFEACIRPGGLLVIDHRNFDSMLDSNETPRASIYYQTLDSVVTSVLYTAGKPVMLTLDYMVNVDALEGVNNKKKQSKIANLSGEPDFRLSYFPHRLEGFTKMLDEVFLKADHSVLSDFQSSELVKNPGFYIHVLQKPL